jgi:hypothetical protein
VGCGARPVRRQCRQAGGRSSSPACSFSLGIAGAAMRPGRLHVGRCITVHSGLPVLPAPPPPPPPGGGGGGARGGRGGGVHPPPRVGAGVRPATSPASGIHPSSQLRAMHIGNASACTESAILRTFLHVCDDYACTSCSRSHLATVQSCRFAGAGRGFQPGVPAASGRTLCGTGSTRPNAQGGELLEALLAVWNDRLPCCGLTNRSCVVRAVRCGHVVLCCAHLRSGSHDSNRSCAHDGGARTGTCNRLLPNHDGACASIRLACSILVLDTPT